MAPFVSFTQTKSFTLSYRRKTGPGHGFFPRLVESPPVEIDELVFDTDKEGAFDERLRVIPFASSFDPIRIKIKNGGGPWTSLARDLSLLVWPRLRRVDLTGPSDGIFRSRDGPCGMRGPGFSGRNPLVGLEYDLSGRGGARSWEYKDLAMELGVPEFPGDGLTLFSSVRIVVDVAEDEEEVKKALSKLIIIPWEVVLKTL